MPNNPYDPDTVTQPDTFSTVFYTRPQQAAQAGAGNASGGGGVMGMLNQLLGGGLYGGGSSGGGGGGPKFASGSLGNLQRQGYQSVIDNINSGQGGMIIGEPNQGFNDQGIMQYYPPPGQTSANLSAPNVDSWGTPTGFKNNLMQSMGNFVQGNGFTASTGPAPTIQYPENSWNNLIANATPPGVQPTGTGVHDPFNGLGGNDYSDFGSASAFDSLNGANGANYGTDAFYGGAPTLGNSYGGYGGGAGYGGAVDGATFGGYGSDY